MFDHVKGKIIEPAKAPNCEHEQKGYFQARLLANKQKRGQNPEQEKEKTFELYPGRIGKIFHMQSI
jgi:hypothetical protein